MKKESCWHIVWTTFGTWQVHDSRGDWQSLRDLYQKIESSQGQFQFKKLLPNKWTNQPQNDFVRLNPEQVIFVNKSIRKLTDNDRIGQQLQLDKLFVTSQSVQLLCRCSKDNLSQTIGRLKSRSATLLTFETNGALGGNQTWANGFWQVELINQVAINLVANFLSNR